MNAPFATFSAPVYRRFSPARIGAVMLRHLYVMRSSWPRLLELIYWPLLQLLTWGFLQTYLVAQTGIGFTAAGVFLGAVILWEVLVRGQLGFNMLFLEEMWSRNMANLLISPLTRFEFILALILMSVIRMAISIVPVTILAILFFGYNLWGLGLGLAAFFANLLLTGWALATLTSGVVLRNGLGAEGLVWSMMFVLLPVCAVFYPVSILPEFLQWVAWALPPTYVFEGMRAIVFDGVFRSDLMLWALGINVILMAAAVAAYARLVDSARNVGSLMAIGE